MKRFTQKSWSKWLMLLAFLGYGSVYAQSDSNGESPVTKTYAFKNATVIQAPGKSLSKTTVLVKNGVISAVGTSVQIPPDAQVIAADSLYIYAGFIDGLNQTGVKRPENQGRVRAENPAKPTYTESGVTPQVSVLEQVDFKSAQLEEWRKAGFTTAHIVPYGRMLPGSGSVVSLAAHGAVDAMVLKGNNSMYAQFTGAGGTYPSNSLGIMAMWRDLYKNAQLSWEHQNLYKANPSGIERPINDQVLASFYPTLNKERSVVFNASGLLEAKRALDLQKQLGFPLILGNLKEGWTLVDQIKASNTKVFLSLALPEKKEAKKAEGDAAWLASEKEARNERIEEAYKMYVAQAATFEKAGIKFGFAGIDAKSGDLKKNLKVMMDNGLSETAALAALTTNPAEILGMSSQLGTVEAGKLANLMISTEPYFTEDAQIKYMMADGMLYEYEIKAPAKKTNGNGNGNASNASFDPAGTWDFTSPTPMGEINGKMVIEKAASGYTGKMTVNTPEGSSSEDMTLIKAEGDKLSFQINQSVQGMTITLNVSGTVSGTKFTGNMDTGQFGAFPISATKNPGL